MQRIHARSVLTALVATLALAVPAGALDPVVPGDGTLDGAIPERGHGTFALTLAHGDFREFWVGDTRVEDPGVGKVDHDMLTLALEWGMTDDLALAVHAAYVDASSDGLGRFEDSGPQDLSALLEWRFVHSGPHSLLVAAGVRTPISDYESNLPVDLGDHTTDLLLRLAYGYDSGAFSFSQQVGFDKRGSDAPDGFPLYTELGYTAGPVSLAGFYEVLIVNDGTDIGDPGFTFPSNREEHTRVGASIGGKVGGRFELSAGYFTTLDGRNAGDEKGYTLGAAVTF
jgi:hypothetical protein